jgi:hypothetical protein
MKVFNNITTKEYLLGVDLPLQTSSYKPVSHSVLINNTLEGIDKSPFTISKEMYYAGGKGQQMLGRFGLLLDDSQIGIQFAFQNSYDKSMSLKVCSGSFLVICSNGECWGSDGHYKHKHTGDVQSMTPLKVKELLEISADKFEEVLKRKERYQEIEMTKKTCAELLGRLYVEEDIINATQLAIVKKEIENPSFNYNAKGSLWEYYNHLTYALQESHPRNYIDKSTQLFNFFQEEYV